MKQYKIYIHIFINMYLIRAYHEKGFIKRTDEEIN